MKEFLEKFKEIKDTIEKNENIILTAHVNPDGDAVGSGLGLFLALKENYKNKANKAADESKKIENKTLTEEKKDDENN